jgi:hypothetical protein
VPTYWLGSTCNAILGGKPTPHDEASQRRTNVAVVHFVSNGLTFD